MKLNSHYYRHLTDMDGRDKYNTSLKKLQTSCMLCVD